MKIGRIMVDTDSMSVEELKQLERELHRIRTRRERGEELCNRLCELLELAKSEGFVFIDKDFGQMLTSTDFTVYDEHLNA